MSGPMKPWEPQPKESTPAFQAFAEYRDLGPERSIEQVSRKLSKSIPLIKRWSAAWSWVRRVQDYDSYLDSIRLDAREQFVAKHARKIMSADEVRAELTDIAEAPWRDFIEIKYDKDGDKLSAQLRLADKIRSLELMGKTHKLFVDKVESESKVTTHSDLETAQAFYTACSKLKPGITIEECALLYKDSLSRIEGDEEKLIG